MWKGSWIFGKNVKFVSLFSSKILFSFFNTSISCWWALFFLRMWSMYSAAFFSIWAREAWWSETNKTEISFGSLPDSYFELLKIFDDSRIIVNDRWQRSLRRSPYENLSFRHAAAVSRLLTRRSCPWCGLAFCAPKRCGAPVYRRSRCGRELKGETIRNHQLFRSLLLA